MLVSLLLSSHLQTECSNSYMNIIILAAAPKRKENRELNYKVSKLESFSKVAGGIAEIEL
jgi:hypothetical protein